jgi:predicted dehydrogenase
MNDELRVGVIGLGIGTQHLTGYWRNPHCRVVVACDRDQGKLSEIRERYPRIRTVVCADDVLDDPDIDVVSIASHDDDHFDQLCKALDNGKHVFVEKPLCQSLEQLEVVKNKWLQHKNSVKIKSNLVLRGAPLYVWAKQQVASGELGDVYAFDGDYLYGRLPKITTGWRAEVNDYSVMEGGGIHLIDLMIWLTQQRPRTILTVGNRICTKGTSFRYNDYVAATMTFDSGMIGRVTANFGCVHGHQHVVRLYGTKGTILYDDQGARHQTVRDPAPPAKPVNHDPLPATKYILIDQFVDAILQDADMSCETQLDFDVMSVCIASDQSLRTATITEIQYA